MNLENPLAVDQNDLLNDEYEYYAYADSLAERQRLEHEISGELDVGGNTPGRALVGRAVGSGDLG